MEKKQHINPIWHREGEKKKCSLPSEGNRNIQTSYTGLLMLINLMLPKEKAMKSVPKS